MGEGCPLRIERPGRSCAQHAHCCVRWQTPGAARGADAIGPCAQGACGYGNLDKGTWPYWSVAALSTSNSFSKAGPVQGCGCAPCACHPRVSSRPGSSVAAQAQAVCLFG